MAKISKKKKSTTSDANRGITDLIKATKITLSPDIEEILLKGLKILRVLIEEKLTELYDK
jgi:hypothetical protein